jgi:predicted DNA-binding transcriptional regulator AlpA
MEKLLKVIDAKWQLNVSRASVYNLSKSGALRSVRIPGIGNKKIIRFRQSDIDEFIKKHTKE